MKNKYKRSAWFEGLLYAEEILGWRSNPDNHIFLEDVDGMEEYDIYWRNSSYEKPWCINTVSREFGKGVLDFIKFKNNS